MAKSGQLPPTQQAGSNNSASPLSSEAPWAVPVEYSGKPHPFSGAATPLWAFPVLELIGSHSDPKCPFDASKELKVPVMSSSRWS